MDTEREGGGRERERRGGREKERLTEREACNETTEKER